MAINKGFSLKTCSDVDREGMVVFICYNDQLIAEINYENGIEKMEIEVFCGKGNLLSGPFLLNDFLSILEKAKQLAIRLAKEDGF